jgi:hypothetical protein
MISPAVADAEAKSFEEGEHDYTAEEVSSESARAAMMVRGLQAQACDNASTYVWPASVTVLEPIPLVLDISLALLSLPHRILQLLQFNLITKFR